MSFTLSKRMGPIQSSETLALSAIANQLKAQGEPIINLTAGEPDFGVTSFVREAVMKALVDGHHSHYTPVDGTLTLKEAIINKLRRDNQLSYSVEQIIVSTGAKQSIYNLMQALLNPGDEVMIPSPYWVSYPSIVQLAEGRPVFIETDMIQAFKITPAQLEQSITPRTRMLILNSPANPTGSVYTLEELRALGEVLSRYPNIIILSDDIYELIYWGKSPFTNIVQACPFLYERTVVVNGVSKAYAMTGWRIGYAAGPVEMIRGMKVIQSQSTSCPNALAQFAAQIALEGDQKSVFAMRAAYQMRQYQFVKRLNRLSGIECLTSEGAFYSFPSFKAILEKLHWTDSTLAKYLLETAKVATVPGSVFGASGYLRLSLVVDLPQLNEVIERISKTLEKAWTHTR